MHKGLVTSSWHNLSSIMLEWFPGFSPARPQVRVIDHTSPPRTAVPELAPSSTDTTTVLFPSVTSPSASNTTGERDVSVKHSDSSAIATGSTVRTRAVSATPSPNRATSASVGMSPFRPSLAARVHTDPIACLVRQRSRQRDAAVEGWVQELYTGEWLLSSHQGFAPSTCRISAFCHPSRCSLCCVMMRMRGGYGLCGARHPSSLCFFQVTRTAHELQWRAETQEHPHSGMREVNRTETSRGSHMHRICVYSVCFGRSSPSPHVPCVIGGRLLCAEILEKAICIRLGPSAHTGTALSGVATDLCFSVVFLHRTIDVQCVDRHQVRVLLLFRSFRH
jgi:hypothetical protein